jgi:steroid 5-alpha reductase family enzyme
VLAWGSSRHSHNVAWCFISFDGLRWPLTAHARVPWQVSGVPLLEEKYDKLYAKDEEYQKYKASTNLLVPWFKS